MHSDKMALLYALDKSVLNLQFKTNNNIPILAMQREKERERGERALQRATRMC